MCSICFCGEGSIYWMRTEVAISHPTSKWSAAAMTYEQSAQQITVKERGEVKRVRQREGERVRVREKERVRDMEIESVRKKERRRERQRERQRLERERKRVGRERY